MNLFLSPHNDDETLFGAFTVRAHKPHVHVCFKSQVQEDRYGITAATREKETDQALWWLGQPSWTQGLIKDSHDLMAPEKLLDDFIRLQATHRPEVVWCPAYEEGGHDQHNLVAFAANALWAGHADVRQYTTYVRGSMRTRTENEVPFEPSWVLQKLRALCCYESQITLENTRPWFMDDTLREYAL